MTTAAPSAALATIQPVFTDAERVALAGFLAGYRGLTREAYALDLRQFASWCRARSAGAVRRPPCRHRVLRQGPGSHGPRPCHGHPAAVHHRRVLQVRRRRRTPGSLSGRACPPSPGRLRVPRDRAGPQRARRTAGDGRARPPVRARADLAARPERAAGLRGHRRRHRAPGLGARPPDLDHHPPSGRQGRDHPAGPRIARAIYLAIGERTEGPAFLARDGRRLDRNGARDVQEAASHADPRTTMRYDRARGSLDRHAAYIVASYLAGAAR